MLDGLRSITKRRHAPVLIWSVAITLALAWPIVAPPVTPQGVAFREDTMSVEMFDMTGNSYAAILGAVETGRLVASDLRDGFKAFTRPQLSRVQLAGRIDVANDVVSRYIATERAAARPTLVAVWAILALILPGLFLGSRAVLGRRPQPLTAPPVRPEMM
jgi:hypothetical protein